MRALLEDMKSGEIAAHEVPAPELREGGILVRTAFSAISSGTEKVTVEAGRKSLLGKALARPDLVKQVLAYARSNGVTAARLKVQARLDTLNALGYSCSGYVLETRTEGFRPGERVACAGVGYASHSEINFVPANLAVRIPDNVSLEAASLTTIGAIAVHGVRQANVSFGETVAVIGAGLVGVLTMQVLRAAGCRVVAVDLLSERAQKAKVLGAHLGLSLNDPSLESSIASFSRYGVDAVIITAATRSAEPLELAAKLLRDRGRISVVGDVGMGVSRSAMYRKEISLTMSRSYGPGRYDPDYEERGHDYPIGFVRWTEKRNMEAFLDLVSSGAIEVKPLLAQMFAVEEGARAYAAVEAGAYTSIIDYHALADVAAIRKPKLVSTVPAAEANGALRVGCIGAGVFARGVIFPLLRSSTGVKLQCVASSTGAAALSSKTGFGFEATSTPSELIAKPDVDLVFILTRHDSHAEYVKAALENRKAVFVEKPLATNREQLESIRTAWATSLEIGRSPLVMVGFNRRFSPFTDKVKAFFAGRSEAMLVHIRCNAGFVPRNSWIQAPEQGGRVVGELCHFVDWARAVVGCRIQRVTAVSLPDAGRYNEDNVSATIEFEDRSVANLLYLANGDRAVGKEHYEVFCAGATARIDDFKTLALSRDGRTETSKGDRDKGHSKELELTIQASRHNKEAPIPFAELIEVTEAVFAIAEAARTGKELLIN